MHKYNDPSASNNFIYKEGQALLANVSYSKKGFGFSLAGKRIDNMSFNADRNLKGQEVSINYLPALTKQHTYTLATIYPYGTITNGEMGIQTRFLRSLRERAMKTKSLMAMLNITWDIRTM